MTDTERKDAPEEPKVDETDDEEREYSEPESGVPHEIEPARSGRARCRACGKPITKGTLRLREVFGSQYSQDVVARFFHLRCGARHKPHVMAGALAASTLDIPERAELEQTIADAVRVRDAAEAESTTSEQYRDFAAAMIADPNDSEAAVVFGDWLQSVDDPRGELIAVQTQLESAEPDGRDALARREHDLLRDHNRAFVPWPLPGRITWRRGFIERLEIDNRTELIQSRLRALFSHPSMLLLRELVVHLEYADDLLVAANLPDLPASLTRLELTVGAAFSPGHTQHLLHDAEAELPAELGHVSTVAASAVNLARLQLCGIADIENLAHPELAALEIAVGDTDAKHRSEPGAPSLSLATRVGRLDPTALPALRELSITADQGLAKLVRALCRNPLIEQLDLLRLGGGEVDNTTAKKLAKRLGDGGIETIDVTTCRLEYQVAELLAPACATLLAPQQPGEVEEEPPPPPEGDWLVRHTRRPQWGIGRVVEEHDDGLEVEFENAGLKMIRGVELLEDVDPE